MQFKKKLSALLIIMALLSPALVRASAPAEIPRTGQTKCYDGSGEEIDCAGTRQDGAIQAGAVWPVPRFTLNGNAVTDELTGLVWAQNANLLGTDDAAQDTDGTAGDGSVTWQHALDYVATLNQNSYLGHKDWRLPNINELESLQDARRSTPTLPQGHPFTNVQAKHYWSSTSKATTAYAAWYVNFNHGNADYGDKQAYNNYVWPVRGSSTSGDSVISLPKTGQTTCYDTGGNAITCAGTGQDGEKQAGVAWPSPRFTDNGATVTDHLTGLEWTKNANPYEGYILWQDALDYVKTLSTGGQSDWRLPNINELRSLSDYSQYNPALPQNHPFEDVSVSGLYGNYIWTSTSRAANANAAKWVRDMVRPFATGTQNQSLVWPVRAGHVGNPLISTTTSTAAPTTTTTTAPAETTTTLPSSETTTAVSTTTSSAPATPVTSPDLYTVQINKTLSVAASDGVLANDTGLNLTAYIVTGPGHGILSLLEDGSFTYTPESGYLGSDTFTYSAHNYAQASPPEEVTIDVLLIDRTPPKCPLEQVLGANNPGLAQLRAFRDETLAQSVIGRTLIKLYYRNAGSINAALNRSPTLREAARKRLTVLAPLVGNTK